MSIRPVSTVLIAGAGPAGVTLAYWLRRHGFTPTVVETGPTPRPGGQAVDVRGPALTVAERMGLGPALRAARTDMRGISLVDPAGTELMSTTETTLTGGPTGGADVEILRDDLTRLLLSAADVEYLYGDRVTALEQDDSGVHLRFAHAADRHVDLVVGADGLHSGIRDLAFPPEEVHLDHLGAHLGVFTMPNRFGLDRWQVFCQWPDRMAGLYTARDNREVRVNLGFEASGLTYHHRDRVRQQKLLIDAFGADGWWLPTMLEGMVEAEDFYFAPMVRVLMDRWSTGRVALVGDAGYCASPLSGQGTSLAMAGAYVLAGELARARDHTRALAEYERRMRPFVAANQELALVNRGRTRELLASGTDPERLLDEHWAASAATAIDVETY